MEQSYTSGVAKSPSFSWQHPDRIFIDWPYCHPLLYGKAKVRSVSKVLTQWVRLAILVRDGEDSDDGVAVLPQLLVNLLAEQTLTNHCDLHPHTSLCSGEAGQQAWLYGSCHIGEKNTFHTASEGFFGLLLHQTCD